MRPPSSSPCLRALSDRVERSGTGPKLPIEPRDGRNQLRIRIDGRIGGVQAVDRSKQYQQIGVNSPRHPRREVVVVTESRTCKLIDGYDIVLVDDRDDTEIEKRRKRIPNVQIAQLLAPCASLAHIIQRQEHLCNGDAGQLEEVLVDVHQVTLPDGGEGLTELHAGVINGGNRATPRRHSAGRDEDQPCALTVEPRHLIDEPRHDFSVRTVRAVGQQGRAGLYDDTTIGRLLHGGRRVHYVQGRESGHSA